MNVDDAYRFAGELLSCGMPRRFLHTKGVAEAGERLARVLAPRHLNDIVSAAWLHDVGYAPDLVDTGFHPVDGARYARGVGFSPNVVSLIAHHTGAVIEARERGLQDPLAMFPFPLDVVELAILSCADLCTGPDGTPVDPGDRITEVLQRYPATDPVHRAITTSGPVLVDQARLVLAAAETARYEQPRVDLPSHVECAGPGRQWRATWPGQHYSVAARRVSETGAGKTVRVLAPIVNGVEISFAQPPEVWEPAAVEWLRADLASAHAAAAGEPVVWQQYRADPPAFWFHVDPDDPTTTVDFDDVVQLHLGMAAQGRPVRIQQRTFTTLSEVTEWTDIADLTTTDPPVDLRVQWQPPAEPNIV